MSRTMSSCPAGMDSPDPGPVRAILHERENPGWALHVLTHIEFYQVLIIVLPEQRLNASVV